VHVLASGALCWLPITLALGRTHSRRAEPKEHARPVAGKGRIKDHWREQQIFERRALFAGVIIVMLTGALITRLAWLQISRNDYFTQLSQGNRVRIEAVPAARGIIYDRNGTILAENRPGLPARTRARGSAGPRVDADSAWWASA
jgi:hypothetical protein